MILKNRFTLVTTARRSGSVTVPLTCDKRLVTRTRSPTRRSLFLLMGVKMLAWSTLTTELAKTTGSRSGKVSSSEDCDSLKEGMKGRSASSSLSKSMPLSSPKRWKTIASLLAISVLNTCLQRRREWISLKRRFVSSSLVSPTL